MVVVGFGKFDLFALVGYGFVRKNIKTRLPLEKKLFRGYKIRPPVIFYLFLFGSYRFPKVDYCIVVIGFGTF